MKKKRLDTAIYAQNKVLFVLVDAHSVAVFKIWTSRSRLDLYRSIA